MTAFFSKKDERAQPQNLHNSKCFVSASCNKYSASEFTPCSYSFSSLSSFSGFKIWQVPAVNTRNSNLCTARQPSTFNFTVNTSICFSLKWVQFLYKVDFVMFIEVLGRSFDFVMYFMFECLHNGSVCELQSDAESNVLALFHP